MSDAFELEICQGKYRYRYEAGKQEVLRNGKPWSVMNDKLIGNKFVFSLAVELDEAIKERDTLRAKIERMERQEPTGKFIQHPSHGMWEQDGYGDNPDAKPLYALPGAQAQPAPSVQDGWLPVPEKHPTFDPVDLQLSDGSVLCGCVPQADGDYWWEGPSGEVFIDPKYANVTHWQIAAPEAKP